MNLNQMMKIQIRINLMRWLVFLFLLLKVRKLSLSVFLVSLSNHASFSWMSQVIFEEVQMRKFCVDFIANKKPFRQNMRAWNQVISFSYATSSVTPKNYSSVVLVSLGGQTICHVGHFLQIWYRSSGNTSKLHFCFL